MTWTLRHIATNFRQSLIAAMLILIAQWMPTIGQARDNGIAAPIGFQIMCLRNPEQCQGGGASQVEAGRATLKRLDAVNRTVNRGIQPRSDGKIDRWAAATSSGDCEDYVLAKRQRLMSEGFPSSALRIAYVKTRTGEGHAILVVRTTKGDYVLDNLTPSVRRLGESGYRILSMSGSDPQVWN